MSTSILQHFGVQDSRPTDDQLLLEARSGDQCAFAELCLRYRDILMKRIYRIVRHREDAEDVLQETLLSAYQHLDSFRGACKFSTWMTTIGINQSLMLLRKRKTSSESNSYVGADEGQSPITSEVRDPRPSPEQHYFVSSTLQGVNQAIDNLPPQFRGVMTLFYIRDLGLRDAAKILGITEGAAKSRLLRARNLLCRSLKYRRKRTERVLEERDNTLIAHESVVRAKDRLMARDEQYRSSSFRSE
jgi:RNA polymerase sigma-70 factor (ECF subfamily)